jgi:formate hydrogenlyase transcriptional activator
MSLDRENAFRTGRPLTEDGSLTDEFGARLERYRDLLDHVRGIVWRTDATNFQFTFVSRFAETLLGYPLQQWTDEADFWMNHIHPEDREWAVGLCIKATKERRAHELEYRMLAADGRVVWLRDLVHVVSDREQPRELVGIMTDITEKKLAERALQQSGDRLRQVIDTIPQQIWSGPADGTMDFCNSRWRQELGLTLEELQGDGWQRMIHPDELERVKQAWSYSVEHGTPYEQEERHLLATGSYCWFLCRGVPLRDEAGEIVRWFGSNTDIQAQKEADEALRNSERRWRGVFDNTNVGVALQDASLRYIDANAAFCRMVGYSCDELRQFTCMEITHEDDRERYKALIHEVLDGKREYFDFEKRYLRKNGELIWARLNGSTIRTGDKPIWVVMAEDVTERKKLSNELQQERDRLRLLFDLSRQFLPKLEPRELFASVLESMQKLGWDWTSILLPDAALNRLIVSLSPDNSYLHQEDALPVKGTLQGKVYRSGEPVFFRAEDLPSLCQLYHDSPKMQQTVNAANMKAGYCLPLVHDGSIIGVLFLMRRADYVYEERDLRFLQELTALIASAVSNSLRFENVNDSHAKLVSQRQYIEDQVRHEGGFERIIGESASLRDILRQVAVVAPTDSTVLITGETGTGKDLIARAVHDHSPRCERGFVKVDCSAIPAALMESELFGHEKGAFTGAIAQKLGRFETADGGTIFLDEVGDIPPELQPKLLRVLQDQSFERVGSNRTRQVNVRIIAATNRDLETMVATGKFRDDLYYRLKVFPIVLPPLRDRRSDIPLLAQYYVSRYARRLKREIPIIPASAMEVFLRYPWPGNVRELQHFIERSVVISSGRHLQAPLAELERANTKRHDRVKSDTRPRTLEQIERDSIIEALDRSNWKVGGPDGAASRLGVKRTTLASRMERLGITRRKA